jgi:hypothetical protein
MDQVRIGLEQQRTGACITVMDYGYVLRKMVD